MSDSLPPWHTSAAEQAVCDSLPGGCPHDETWMESLENLRSVCSAEREPYEHPACCGIHFTQRPGGHCDWTCCQHEVDE